jgi:hypothetical protein
MSPFDAQEWKIWLIEFSPTEKLGNEASQSSLFSENKSYRLLQSRNRRHIETGDDCHQAVKVANIERLTCRLDPKFNDSRTLFLFRVL